MKIDEFKRFCHHYTGIATPTHHRRERSIEIICFKQRLRGPRGNAVYFTRQKVSRRANCNPLVPNQGRKLLTINSVRSRLFEYIPSPWILQLEVLRIKKQKCSTDSCCSTLPRAEVVPILVCFGLFHQWAKGCLYGLFSNNGVPNAHVACLSCSI